MEITNWNSRGDYSCHNVSQGSTHQQQENQISRNKNTYYIERLKKRNVFIYFGGNEEIGSVLQ